jgi:hypothetical protein
MTHIAKKVELPKFNKVIHVEVDLDMLHKQLLSTFPEDYKHKEILSHAIVGSAAANGGLGYIYSAINGHVTKIDFQVGDHVKCEDDVVEIVEIDVYAKDKLRVKDPRSSRSALETLWVNHKDCTKIPMEVVAI